MFSFIVPFQLNALIEKSFTQMTFFVAIMKVFYMISAQVRRRKNFIALTAFVPELLLGMILFMMFSQKVITDENAFT